MTAIVRERAASKSRSLFRPPAMTTLFTLVFLLGGWRSGLTRLSDNSFFWHLVTGGWILDHGIPREDIYSFTAEGSPWIVQSWLAEVLYASLERLFGPFGVRVLGGVTGALVAGLSYRFALRLARDRLRAAVVAVGAIGASLTLWAERPLFLGILAMVALLWVVEVPDSPLGRRPMISIPIIMWLWANVHGTFSLGFVYLVLHLAGRWVDGFPLLGGDERRLARATAVGVLATLVNPYGIDMLVFPFELVTRGDILRQVIEWSSPDFRSPQGIAFGGWLALFIFCLARGPQRPTRRDLVVSVPFILMALWAQRNIALAPLVGMPVAARCLAASSPRPETHSPLNRVMLILVVFVGLLFTVDAAAARDFDYKEYPVEAMAAVEDHGLLGKRLLTDDAWAGYVILRYWPEQRVFVDDRYDMYPPSITKDFIRFSDVAGSWREVLEDHDIEVLVWFRGHPVTVLLDREPQWERIHSDEKAVVYVRRSS